MAGRGQPTARRKTVAPLDNESGPSEGRCRLGAGTRSHIQSVPYINITIEDPPLTLTDNLEKNPGEGLERREGRNHGLVNTR
jgi:hypothetical protein